jgi:hypothetical protein
MCFVGEGKHLYGYPGKVVIFISSVGRCISLYYGTLLALKERTLLVWEGVGHGLSSRDERVPQNGRPLTQINIETN